MCVCVCVGGGAWGSYSFCNAVLRPEFLLVGLWGLFFSDLGLGDENKKL